VALWESVEPAAGFERRQAANSARAIVDELYEDCGLYYEVISKLKDDNTIIESVRRVAIQIANARLCEDVRELSIKSGIVALSPDHNEMTYREAMEKAKKAVNIEPDSFISLMALGAAQYRIGAYEDTLATFTRVEKVRDDTKIKPGPAVDGFRAMALRQLGRNKEAKAALQQLRGRLKEEWFSVDDPGFGDWVTVFLTLVVEVEKLFAGEDSTLLSIWELIEENKLDEASELIEKLRLSKNADYVNRMEGAIKLLEVLHNLK
ncbi:MAG: hypothetical protein WBC05_24970, partial [Sedimentisphaerales bacterium]